MFLIIHFVVKRHYCVVVSRIRDVGIYSFAGSDDEWMTVGPEDEHNWLNVSGLESGSEYEVRVVAMNNGDNKTTSAPTVIYVGERTGR